MGLFRRAAGSNCAACKAKDQSIMIFADQVDYLRNQIAENNVVPSATTAVQAPIMEPLRLEVLDSDDLRMSEEEEEIRFAQSQGFMSSAEAEAAIQAIIK